MLILIMFLLSNRFMASKSSFFFLPVNLKLWIISFTGIPGFPKLAFLRYRFFTISLSSFPHLQVVLRIRITIVLTSFCVSSLLFPPKVAHNNIIYVYKFLDFVSRTIGIRDGTEERVVHRIDRAGW